MVSGHIQTTSATITQNKLFSSQEPAIAWYLRQEGHMIQTECIDLEKYKVLSSWVVCFALWLNICIQSAKPIFYVWEFEILDPGHGLHETGELIT